MPGNANDGYYSESQSSKTQNQLIYHEVQFRLIRTLPGGETHSQPRGQPLDFNEHKKLIDIQK